jgi:general secretion pathway protein F
MPAYQFEALDSQGNTRKGVMEADSAKSARSVLRAQALVPIAMDAVTGDNSKGGGHCLVAACSTPPGWRYGRARLPAW